MVLRVFSETFFRATKGSLRLVTCQLCSHHIAHIAPSFMMHPPPGGGANGGAKGVHGEVHRERGGGGPNSQLIPRSTCSLLLCALPHKLPTRTHARTHTHTHTQAEKAEKSGKAEDPGARDATSFFHGKDAKDYQVCVRVCVCACVRL